MDKNINEKELIYLYFRKTSLKLRVPCKINTSEWLTYTKIIKCWLFLTNYETVFCIRNNIFSTFEEFSGRQILWERYWSRSGPGTPANIQN